MNNTLCDIIIPVHDQLESLKLCIASLFKNTKTGFKLIIVDDASGPLTRDYINSLKVSAVQSVEVARHCEERQRRSNPGFEIASPSLAARGRNDVVAAIQLIRFENNGGFVHAVNAGLAQSDSKYVCLLNSDTIVAQGWLERMLEVAEANPGIGLLNPNSSTFHVYPKRPDIENINIISGCLLKYKGSYQEMTNCVGFCMLIKREVLDKIGNLSSDYGLGYYEDLDFSKKAQAAGFMSAMAVSSYVYHFEKKTFAKINSRENIIKANKAFFENRWGKSLRIMVVRPLLTDDALEACLTLARKWSLVYLYTFADRLVKNKLIKKYSPHQNLRVRRVWPVNIVALVKAVKRAFSPKKAYDAAILDNKLAAFVLHIALPGLPVFYLDSIGMLHKIGVKSPAYSIDSLADNLRSKNG